MEGGDQGGRDPPAPQQLVGIEEQGEVGLSLHGGGGRGGWRGLGGEIQLVGLELETILAGQGDIREVRVGLKLSEDKGPKLGSKLRHTLHLCQSVWTFLKFHCFTSKCGLKQTIIILKR